jgi:hypothetical protein
MTVNVEGKYGKYRIKIMSNLDVEGGPDVEFYLPNPSNLENHKLMIRKLSFRVSRGSLEIYLHLPASVEASKSELNEYPLSTPKIMLLIIDDQVDSSDCDLGNEEKEAVQDACRIVLSKDGIVKRLLAALREETT